MLWCERVFALPGITLLVVFVLARPQEFVAMLQRLPFLHLFTLLAVLGYVIDIRLRRLQPIATNTLPWVIAFLLWSVLSTAVMAPDTLVAWIMYMIVMFALYGTVAHGIQRFRSLQLVTGVLGLTTLFIAAICFHQGLAAKQCIAGTEEDGAIEGKPDGRECDTNETCRGPDAEPGEEYRCEHVGLFGTYSVGERVRYRGELNDPNEVALAIASGGMAMLLGFAMRRKGASPRSYLYAVAIAICVVAVFFTKSRGGLVAMMLVPGVYAVRKWGWSVIVPGVLLAVPVMILGGRSDEAADLSTEMRYDAWTVGLDMWHHSPVFGVGARQFTAHNYLTAHNSFVLMIGELGIVGLFLFSAIIYLCIKTLVIGLRMLDGEPGTRAAQIWGMAMLAAMAGIVFQINTLSFAYHMLLWLFFGLCGAWYSAVKHHKPEFEVKLTFVDLIILAVGTILYATVALPLFLKAKGQM
jgi:hypothetical protein